MSRKDKCSDANSSFSYPLIGRPNTVSTRLHTLRGLFIAVALALYLLSILNRATGNTHTSIDKWFSDVSSSFGRHEPCTSKHSIHNDEDWDKLPSLPYLQYQRCYDGLQCARLELPLDYFNGTTNETISLAIIRQPAIVPVTSPNYGGAIILNPGGPGGSGVGLVQYTGKDLRTLLDSPASAASDGHAMHYDLIGFDPRGVRLTTPSVHCFENYQIYRAWLTRTFEQGTLASSDDAFTKLWAMAHAAGASCARTGAEDIKHFVATSYVATDMLRLVEAHGKWREQEAEHEMVFLNPSGSSIDVDASLRYKSHEERIQYYGFSYGTLLGATFASMYPNRIKRMILDGVVDAYDYTANLWYDNLVDTEKAVDSFFHHCARVGPKGCALAETGASAHNISQRVASIYEGLRDSPLPLLGPNPDVLSDSPFRKLMLGGLYSPIVMFPIIAKALKVVETGLEMGYADLSDLLAPVSPRSDEPITLPRYLASTAEDREPTVPDNTEFAQNAIQCSDGDSSTHLTKSVFKWYLADMLQLSAHAGDIWASLRLACTGWRIRAKHRFTGPWEGNTSHPILWIGNSADPVTPVGSARKMAKGFEGSVVLEVNGTGHCSVAAPSLCAVEVVRRYLREGVLPEKGTVCQPDVLPFGDGKEDGVVNGGWSYALGGGAEGDAVRAQHEVGMGLRGVGGGLAAHLF